MLGADHELRGHRCAVGAGGEVGDVALQTGKGPRPHLQGPVHGADEPVELDGYFPGDGFLGLGDLLVDAAQGAPGTVVAVLVVDDLVGRPPFGLAGHG